jgi:hypothetical protein
MTPSGLSARHRRTLEAIFRDPAPANIRWAAIESLLVAAGAEVTERRGSAISVYLNGEAAAFHRPHPRREAGRGLVRDVRELLVRAGITYGE